MLMALKRNQKGLTLIELLAVLVIVGIIAAIAIPAIGGTIEKSKVRADESSAKMIEEAALRYIVDESLTVAQATDITIATLVSKGYLNSAVTWQSDKSKKYTKFSGTHNTTGGWVVTLSE